MPHQHDWSKHRVGSHSPYLWWSFRPTIDTGNEATVGEDRITSIV